MAAKYGFNTRVLHGSPQPQFADGSTLPPIAQANAFAHPSAESHEAVFANRKPGFAYSRVANPTVAELERVVNRMEDGAATVAYASGMAALTALFVSLLQEGDTIVSAPCLYGGTVELMGVLQRLGVRTVFVKENTPEAFEQAIDETTRLLFTETIGNPFLDVADIAGLAHVAHAHGIPLAVDNTVTTPYLVQPLALGADLVVNSTSKFIDGSSNALGGTLTYSGRFSWDFAKFPGLEPFARFGTFSLVARLRNDVSPALGGCQSPQNAFYTLIGTQTLGVRMDRICASAQQLAQHLAAEGARGGFTVRYPGLLDDPGYELAKRQFGGKFGGIFTLRLGTKERAFAFLDALELASIVSNIGDARTLVVHPATTIAAHLTPQEQEASGVFPDMVRVCVGLEDAEDLVADFDAALGKIEEEK